MRRHIFAAFQKALLISLGVMLPVSNIAWSQDNNDFVRAEIYYVDWTMNPMIALSPRDVRVNPVVKTVIANRLPLLAQLEIGGLWKFLHIEDMRPANDTTGLGPEDARLVIDFFRSDGTRVTYYASVSHLISADNRMKRSINEDFRKRFTFNSL